MELSNRGQGIKAKKCLYEGVIVPTALNGAEALGMRSAERRKVNVLEIKCLRGLVGVSRMDTLNNHGYITQQCLNPTLTGNHHSHHFAPGHTPYYLHKNSALLSTISTN